MKSFIALLIFDISLSSQAVGLSMVIFVDASFCFVAIDFNSSPGVIWPGQGDSEKNLCLPALCLTFGGVYGTKSICFFASNSLFFNPSLIKGCLNKVPNITGCCPSSPSKKNPTTTSPP